MCVCAMCVCVYMVKVWALVDSVEPAPIPLSLSHAELSQLLFV